MSKKGRPAKEPYDQLSPTHRCKDCGKGIKARLVRIHPKPPSKCYQCFQVAKIGRRRAQTNPHRK